MNICSLEDRRLPIVKMARLPDWKHDQQEMNYPHKKRKLTHKGLCLPEVENQDTAITIQLEVHEEMKSPIEDADGILPVVIIERLKDAKIRDLKKSKNYTQILDEKKSSAEDGDAILPVVKVERLKDANISVLTNSKKYSQMYGCEGKRHRTGQFVPPYVKIRRIPKLEEHVLNNCTKQIRVKPKQNGNNEYELICSDITPNSQNLMDRTRRNERKQIYCCRICRKHFSIKHHLALHQLTHKNSNCDTCSDDLTFNDQYWDMSTTDKNDSSQSCSIYEDDDLRFSESIPKEIQSDLELFDIEMSQIKSDRLLTDDEVLAGVAGLSSDDVVVLSPAVCLKIRLSSEEDVWNMLMGIDLNRDIIIAPISDAEGDESTGYNTEGSHWSLVVINLVRLEYYHLDSLFGLNQSFAYQFCEKINFYLDFKPFKFIVKECRQQNDSYSCGWEVIRNAKIQVSLLRREIMQFNLTSSTALTPHAESAPKLVIMRYSEVKNLSEFVKQFIFQNGFIGSSKVESKLCLSSAPRKPRQVTHVGDGLIQNMVELLYKLMIQNQILSDHHPRTPRLLVADLLAHLAKSLCNGDNSPVASENVNITPSSLTIPAAQSCSTNLKTMSNSLPNSIFHSCINILDTMLRPQPLKQRLVEEMYS